LSCGKGEQLTRFCLSFLDLQCCLWTRRTIRDCVLRDFRIALPLGTLGHCPGRWGFSIQSAVKKAGIIFDRALKL
jgi:hypothetical protein